MHFGPHNRRQLQKTPKNVWETPASIEFKMKQDSSVIAESLSSIEQLTEGDGIRPAIADRVQEALREYDRLHEDLPVPDSPRYR